MIAVIGDVHDRLDSFFNELAWLPRYVETVIQLGDLSVWPEPSDAPPNVDGVARVLPDRPPDPRVRWRRPPRDGLMMDGDCHTYPLTRGLRVPTRIAPGLTYLPRGMVLTLPGRHGPLRVGVLGGAERRVDTEARRPGEDWWPEEERVTVGDVERLLANAAVAGGVDLLITHTPPASVTYAMTGGRAPQPSAVLVQEAWQALGGGVPDPPLDLVCGHMHAPHYDEALRVDVLPTLGLALR